MENAFSFLDHVRKEIEDLKTELQDKSKEVNSLKRRIRGLSKFLEEQEEKHG